MRGSNKKYISIMLFLGLLMLSPLFKSPSNAFAEESYGRKNAMVTGHASADDNEFRIQLNVGDTRSERVNPRAIYAKGIDQVYLYAGLNLSDDSDEATYDKNYAKAKKGYKLETVSGDSSIVKVTSRIDGYYSLKGMKEGSTVIRFYESYKGEKRYLGCRKVYVGNADITEDTVTLFIGSQLRLPTSWVSQNYTDTNPKTGLNLVEIPENKALFKKVYYSAGSKEYYYIAAKTGKSKVTAKINGKNKTYVVNIVEPFISKNAKLNYTLYAGNEMDLSDCFYLFDYRLYDVEEKYLKLVSDNKKVASAEHVVLSENNQYNKITTNSAGTAHIKVYFVYGGKSKYLGEMKLKVVATQLLRLTDTTDQLIVGQSYQFQAETIGTSEKITWSVSDPAIAQIDDTGLLTTKDIGSVTVTAAAGDVKATYVVTVKDKKKLTISGRTEFVAGEESNYTVASLKNGAAVTWSLSDDKKAAIKGSSRTITLIPCETGTVTLYAETATARGELKITIKNIEIKGPTEISVGKVEWYSLIINYREDMAVNWETSDESIIKIMYYNGKTDNVDVSAVSPGTATLTAYNEYGGKVSITITVKP